MEDIRKLLEELGLDGPDPGAAVGPEVLTPAGGPTAPASPFALKLDAWDVNRGAELLGDEPGAFRGLPPEAAADFLGAAFLHRPEPSECCADPLRKTYLEGVLDSPDFAAARGLTRGNLAESRAAALKLAEACPRPKPGERPAAPRGAGPGEGPDAAGGRAFAAGVNAAAEAADAAEEAREMMTACGMGPGVPGSGPYDPMKAAALSRMARTNPRVRKVCDYAGVFRRVGLSKRSMRTTHGLDDVVGVTLGGDVSRLIPAELVKLRSRAMRRDLLVRLVDRRCMVTEYAGREPAGKGPVILCVDSSGSMLYGDKLEAAKGLCLAMAFLARTQRRWVGLVDYSGDTGHSLLSLTPGRWPDDLVARWMASAFGGGSCLDVPVREMPRFYDLLGAPRGKTDVVFFTDAICRIPPGVRDAFNAWKAKVRARVTTLVIQSEPGDLAGVSDEVHVVPYLAADGEAVGKVLTL